MSVFGASDKQTDDVVYETEEEKYDLDPYATPIGSEQEEIDFSFETVKYNFLYIESLYPCQVYVDGILPGMEKMGNNQVITVKNFKNYMEFAKIKDNEFEYKDGVKILTSRYFDSRYIGFTIPTEVKKTGRTVGWYVHGKIYSVEDSKAAIKHLFENFFAGNKSRQQLLSAHIDTFVSRYA